MLLALSLRRGLILYHETQRGPDPAPWAVLPSPLVRRQEVQTFGILGLGRIGAAAALRAKAFGYRVVFYDPNQPNGWDRALGIQRARSLEELLAQSDVLSIHCPLTRSTRGLIGEAQLRMLPTQRRGGEHRARADPRHRCAGALPARRPYRRRRARRDPGGAAEDPVPSLLRAYRAKEDWLQGRLVITPHIAFHSPEAWDDIRLKGVETMRDVLVEGRRTNVIPPERLDAEGRRVASRPAGSVSLGRSRRPGRIAALGAEPDRARPGVLAGGQQQGQQKHQQAHGRPLLGRLMRRATAASGPARPRTAPATAAASAPPRSPAPPPARPTARPARAPPASASADPTGIPIPQ